MTTQEVVHDRHGGTTPVRCRGCARPWPCPDADLVPLKPYSKYVCPNDLGHGGHSSMWTGANNPAIRARSDGYCRGCGALMVEETDDGTRWRVSFEIDTGGGWHTVERETSSERDARSQVNGLLLQEADGEPVRNVVLARAAVGWEPVDTPNQTCSRYDHVWNVVVDQRHEPVAVTCEWCDERREIASDDAPPADDRQAPDAASDQTR